MTEPHSRRGGPPLLAVALPWAALTLVGTALHPGTRVGADPATTLGLLRDHALSAQLSALALLASAFPLAVWVAAAHHRLHRLGLRVAGPTIGLAGGLLAVVLLAVSGITAWSAVAAATVPGDATAGVVVGLVATSFAAGGAGFATAFGLLIAGLAVPVLLAGLVPRALAVAGLALAVVAVVALLSLVVPALGPLLPVVRFGGLIWLVWVSAVLPVSRRRVGAAPQAEAVTS